MSNSWIKNRHKQYRKLLYPVITMIIGKYHCKTEVFDDIKNRPYLILYNHQTPMDQFLIARAFPTPLYFVATEDIFSLGWKSRAIEHIAAPIPIKKNGNDLRAVKSCIKVAREGGSIAIAPEGNRTFSGTTEHIKPSIVKLIQALKLPVVFVKLEGGYNKQARWSDEINEGTMNLRIGKVLEYEDYRYLEEEELYKLVEDNLYQDDRGFNNAEAKSVEGLERVIYVCPNCGFTEFASKGFDFNCKNCGLRVTYHKDRTFTYPSGKDFEFKTVKEWFDYQNKYINSKSLEDFHSELHSGRLYADNVALYEVIPYKNKKLINKKSEISINDHSLRIYTTSIFSADSKYEDYEFTELENIAVCGKNKLEIYVNKDKIYQVVGRKNFNAVKYMNIYHRINNLRKGENNEFLGL